MLKKLNKITLFAALSSFLLLSGCALFRTNSTQTPNITIFKNTQISLPSPKALDINMTASQLLTATYNIDNKIKSYTTEVQVESSSNKITLVAVSGWGGALFSLVYDGKSIQSSSLPMPNANMGIKQTLSDFIFTYASEKVLNTMLLGTGIQLQQSENKRIFSQQGKVLMDISYTPNIHTKNAEVYLKNHLYHYQIKIKTIESN